MYVYTTFSKCKKYKSLLDVYLVSCMRTDVLYLFYVLYTIRNIICHMCSMKTRECIVMGVLYYFLRCKHFLSIYQIITFSRARKRKKKREGISNSRLTHFLLGLYEMLLTIRLLHTSI